MSETAPDTPEDPAESDGTDDQPLAPAQAALSMGWLVSFALHSLVFVVLTLVTFPPLPLSTTLSLLASPPPAERLEDAIDLDEVSFDLSPDDLTTPLDAAAASPLDAPTPDAVAPPAPAMDLSTSLASAVVSASTDLGLSVVPGVGADGRTAERRAALVAAKGGSPASEAAVARGLKWLAEHQNPNGTWSLVHNRGDCRGRCDHAARIPGDEDFSESLSSATGLALLPFLGAGETQERGRYRRVVRDGLRALVRLGKLDEDHPGHPGRTWADSGRMYAHGISAIVLCEAYSMTKEPELRAPAQAALEYLAYAQDPAGGGWRYRAQQAGDTSVTGWQVMALKSGQLAGLELAPRVTLRAGQFLDSASADGGARYGYLSAATPEEGEEPGAYYGTATLSAVGLLCRMYLGWDQSDERLVRGVARLVEEGPREGNFYHNYYAAQAIFHQTGGVGPLWREWNEQVRDMLVDQQSRRGHENGSWWVEGPHNDRGGRLYTTSLATMTLEVYYRYLPLYKSDAVELEFPE